MNPIRTKKKPRSLHFFALHGGALVCTLFAFSCGSPAKTVLAEAAELEAQGKLEEAAAKLESGCALSPTAEPCPQSDRKACEIWQKAAEKATSEGRYRDAERLFHRAMLTADESTRTSLIERLARADLVSGLKFERALFVGDKALATKELEEVAKQETAAATKAKEWLAKERPAVLLNAVKRACGTGHEGSCSQTASDMQAAGLKGPEVDEAVALADAEARRVYPLRIQAEGFLPIFASRFTKNVEYKKCTEDPSGSTEILSECLEKVYGGTPPDDRFDVEKIQNNLFRRTLKQIGDSAITDALAVRRKTAETSGVYSKLDVPKPKPAPKR